MDALEAARYPFRREASAWIGEHGPSLEELLSDRVYEGARRRGRDRLLQALEDATKAPAPLSAGSGEREVLEEVLSYGFSRMLVSALEDKYVVRRHALSEAVRVKAYLEDEPDEDVVRACAAEVDLDVGEATAEGDYPMHFTEYLRVAVHLKDPDWKLVNQPLAHGRVILPQDRLARLVQEALRRRIEGELPKKVPDDVKAQLEPYLGPVREAAEERKSQMAASEFGEVDLACMPPCMEHILAMLQRGENAPHTARFAITSFLHTIGMDAEEIIRLFAEAPDFREDLTRYQVEHITGVTSDTEYSPPGCRAMKTYGICYNADSRCKATNPQGELYVTHPLSYYRWALKDKKRGRPPREKDEAEKTEKTEKAEKQA